MEHFLSDFLYYNISEKKFGELLKGLKEYRFLLSALDESIKSFENGDLEKFDSLVGENACQIRAIRIALIHSKNSLKQKNTSNKLQQYKKIIEELLHPKKLGFLMTNGFSLKEVLEENNLNIYLTQEEVFMLKAFLLTEMKEVQSEGDLTNFLRKSKCVPIRIKRLDDEMSYTFANRLASHLRQWLSSSSVDFVREAAEELNDSNLMRMVSDEFTIEHNGLNCIPMFWTYKILLDTAKKNGIPIIVHIKFLDRLDVGSTKKNEKYIFFKPIDDSTGRTYIKTEPSDLDLSKAACVVQGIAYHETEWDEKSLSSSIVDVILAGAADHRQYPNPDVNIVVDDIEFENFKSMAVDKGFSFTNPNTFFIQHVYPAKVEKMISLQ